MVRIIRALLLIVLYLAVPFIMCLFLDKYSFEQEEIKIYKNAKQVSAESLPEFYGQDCWFKGIAVSLEKESLISPVTKQPCVYYSYLKEEWVKYERSDGTVEGKWETVEGEKKSVDINLLVGETDAGEYSIDRDDILFIGKTAVDKQQVIELTVYRITLDIIPAGEEVWVFGRPFEKEIKKPSFKEIILTLKTPEGFMEYLQQRSVLEFILAAIFIFLSIGPALGVIYNLQSSGKELIPKLTDIFLFFFAFLLLWFLIFFVYLLTIDEYRIAGIAGLIFTLIFLIALVLPIKTKIVQLFISLLSLFLSLGLFLVIFFIIRQHDTSYLINGIIIIVITFSMFLLVINKREAIAGIKSRGKTKYRVMKPSDEVLSRIPPTKRNSTCLNCNTINPPGVRCCINCKSMDLKENKD
jgi:hypothetical protein